MEVENDVTWDFMMVTLRTIQGARLRWPTRKYVANVLRYRIAARTVSAQHLRLMGISAKSAISMIKSYSTMHVLAPAVEESHAYDVSTGQLELIRRLSLEGSETDPGHTGHQRLRRKSTLAEINMRGPVGNSSGFGSVVQQQHCSASVSFRGNVLDFDQSLASVEDDSPDGSGGVTGAVLAGAAAATAGAVAESATIHLPSMNSAKMMGGDFREVGPSPSSAITAGAPPVPTAPSVAQITRQGSSIAGRFNTKSKIAPL